MRPRLKKIKKSIIFAKEIPESKNVKTLKVTLLLLLLLPLTARAQGGESAFNFLRLPYSSRASALGGSNISVVDDDLSLSMHNPALLINVADKTVKNEFASKNVADAVKNILVNKDGIAANRINAIGHGVGDIFSEPAWNRVGICTIDESE